MRHLERFRQEIVDAHGHAFLAMGVEHVRRYGDDRHAPRGLVVALALTSASFLSALAFEMISSLPVSSAGICQVMTSPDPIGVCVGGSLHIQSTPGRPG